MIEDVLEVTEDVLITFRSIPGTYQLTYDLTTRKVLSLKYSKRFGSVGFHDEVPGWNTSMKLKLMKFSALGTGKQLITADGYITEDEYFVSVPHLLDHHEVKRLRTKENIDAAIQLLRL